MTPIDSAFYGISEQVSFFCSLVIDLMLIVMLITAVGLLGALFTELMCRLLAKGENRADGGAKREKP